MRRNIFHDKMITTNANRENQLSNGAFRKILTIFLTITNWKMVGRIIDHFSSNARVEMTHTLKRYCFKS